MALNLRRQDGGSPPSLKHLTIVPGDEHATPVCIDRLDGSQEVSIQLRDVRCEEHVSVGRGTRFLDVGDYRFACCPSYFENARNPDWYIGSADWMTRNLDHRVVAVTPVEATRLCNQLRLVLEVSLTNNRRRWMMQSDGSYEQVTPDDEPVRDTQKILLAATDAALERGYGPGMEVDMDLIEEGLLIEPIADGGVEGDRDLSATTVDSDGDEEGDSDSGTTSVFDRYAEQWYHPDSETYDWAVRTRDGDRRYFKTRDGARTRLRAEYEIPS